MAISRRGFMGVMGGGAIGAAGLWPRRAVAAVQSLTIQPASYAVLDVPTQGMVSAFADAPPPVIRMRQGQPFAIDVTNATPDYTAMHWHGLRVPNAMDGVPYLTQFPIAEAETFRYAFTPTDAGTYWYHPHCMTMDQMARGMTGVLIVDEADPLEFDSEVVLNLRDFRLNSAGEFIDLWTARGAARSGTFGTVMTANWNQLDLHDVPTGGLVRLRLVATDTTRIYKMIVAGAAGAVIAMDGHPLREPVPFPSAEKPLILSPGQRAEIVLKMPDIEGAEVTVLTDAPGGPRALAQLRSVGANLGRALADAPQLLPNRVSEPDLTAPRVEEFVFGWTPEGGPPVDGLCGSLGYAFWSINRTPWQGDAAEDTPALATFQKGENVVLRLRNESPNDHPIHLHGMTFRPISSNKRVLPSNWTDTALLLREETIEIAMVMDNPGDWAFHCHVIEHQKTGLAGFIRVLG
ncbi:Multicopper oxidase with three cupredoxin domains (includes cell division protein FtsP and spore coat protein CotA) [Yoonia tamlensis]|uniref:Multicopper oxidase with three cupredoxin domains (Includes cell division protein FtsP and spore coat protein CotA) n=1 Tax=Yoonia tamlensis TaxID=390270 RepID=A0A1I6GSS9_9RHOB|nr:multicopper oxidase family protein [Yoonia tamlensis]SFR45141.1 Multicopper oxidase with three cupredoxin domains (includes cell division protein FtsP and spore coat protein CotA) [Yoonia tamlensis]